MNCRRFNLVRSVPTNCGDISSHGNLRSINLTVFYRHKRVCVRSSERIGLLLWTNPERNHQSLLCVPILHHRTSGSARFHLEDIAYTRNEKSSLSRFGFFSLYEPRWQLLFSLFMDPLNHLAPPSSTPTLTTRSPSTMTLLRPS